MEGPTTKERTGKLEQIDMSASARVPDMVKQVFNLHSYYFVLKRLS